MKQIYTTIVACLLFLTCTHDFNNPSDPDADSYSVSSNAVLHLITTGDIIAGDTVYFYGGLSSDAVEEAALVTDYKWDFDGNGTTDRILKKSDTLGIVYDKVGTYRCILTLTDKAGFTDTASKSIQVVKPQIVKDTTKVTITLIVDTDDTINVVIDIKKPVQVVTRSGDTIVVIATAKDSVKIITNTIDTMSIRVKPMEIVTVSTTLIDTLTYPHIDTIPAPIGQIYLPVFPSIPGFPNIDGGECAFFTTDSSLMRTTLNFYDVMWEQTRSDGLEAIKFVEKLVSDIIGYSIITLVGGDYSYTFNNGIYLFSSSTGFKISCAFHYGAGIGGHAENDTIRANLFLAKSYISGLKGTLTSPFYSYTEGPLFDLLDGNVQIDKSLNVSFTVNFSKLKISFSRATVHESASLPIYVVNDSIGLPVTQTSYARMAPVYMLDFADLFHKDSILINHDGSSMSSKPVALNVIFRSDSTFRKATYSFTIQQKMDTQRTAYGDHNGILKLSGNYAATATLGFNNFPNSTFFTGRYSSAVHDSSWFYCDKQLTNEFGTLFFGETSDSVGIFNSKKYNYAFPYTPLKVSVEQYRKLVK